jgi:methanogenic corrinoid protein MtbC1
LCNALFEERIPPYECIMNGLVTGMDTVGSLYGKKEYFVPELLLCSDALYPGAELWPPPD